MASNRPKRKRAQVKHYLSDPDEIVPKDDDAAVVEEAKEISDDEFSLNKVLQASSLR